MHFKGVNNRGLSFRGWFVCTHPVVYCIIFMIQGVWSFLCALFFATIFNDTILLKISK